MASLNVFRNGKFSLPIAQVKAKASSLVDIYN